MELPRVDELNLYSLTFDDFSLNEDEMLLATITMFTELGLINKFGIDKVVSLNIYIYSIVHYKCTKIRNIKRLQRNTADQTNY